MPKDKAIDEDLQLSDSLARIHLEPKEVRMVKLADRIPNLALPPASWCSEMCAATDREPS